MANDKGEDVTTVSAGRRFCSLPPQRMRVLPADLDPRRARMIQVLASKWVNETTLHFHFFDSEGSPAWKAKRDVHRQAVRNGFAAWKELGIGLKFTEVPRREDAEVRIAFVEDDGAWSYVGRDVLLQGKNDPTMNFGWDVTDDADTVLHEIGHTLGLPHEHQNPNAGIVWNEEAVYAALAAPPNSWNREKTFFNIIRKIDPQTVRGSNWDPNSIMHYPFGKGLILEPPTYRNGLTPEGGLSALDRQYALEFYPKPAADATVTLEPFKSIKLELDPGQQRNFVIEPKETRNYTIQTFGVADTVMVLFEERDGQAMYVSADDDSGFDRNAFLRLRLVAGRKYVLRLRLYFAFDRGETALMMW